VDNGKDFRSMALQRGCEEHGINLSWRPVRTPHYGAHIERLIGTLMKIAHLLPGTTFSNIRERGDYDSAGKARLTLAEFRQWMTQKVCRFYHVRRHRSLGLAPLVAWERGWMDDSGKLVSPPLLSRPLDFRMDFLPYEFRRVRRTGIEFNKSRYWHDDLAPMLNLPDEVMVRYDPREPGQIWVRRQDGVLVTVPAIAGPAAGAATARLAIDDATRARLDAGMDLGFETTDRIEADAVAATVQARRQVRGNKKTKADATQPSPSNHLPGHLPPMTPPRRNPIPVEVWN
jgi:putative transposase